MLLPLAGLARALRAQLRAGDMTAASFGWGSFAGGDGRGQAPVELADDPFVRRRGSVLGLTS